MAIPLIDWSKFVPGPDSGYASVERSYGAMTDTLRAMAAARARQEEAARQEKARQEQIAIERQRMAMQQERENRIAELQRKQLEMEQAAAKTNLLANIAPHVGSGKISGESASTVLGSAGMPSQVVGERPPLGLPSAPETQLQTPEMAPAPAQPPSLGVGQLTPPEPPAPLLAPPQELRKKAIKVAYGDGRTGLITLPEANSDEQGIKDLQVMYSTGVSAMGDRVPHDVRDKVVAAAPEAWRVSKGDSKEARSWLAQYEKSLMADWKRKKAAEGKTVKPSGNLLTDAYRRMNPETRQKIFNEQKWIIEKSGIQGQIAKTNDSETVASGLLRALNSPDPGAQKAAVWELATAWNGKRLTDADVSRIYGFGTQWDLIASNLNQWAPLAGPDKMGTLSPALITQLKNAAKVMQERIGVGRKRIQDDVYNRALSVAPTARAVFTPEEFKQWAADTSGWYTPNPTESPNAYNDLKPEQKSKVDELRQRYSK